MCTYRMHVSGTKNSVSIGMQHRVPYRFADGIRNAWKQNIQNVFYWVLSSLAEIIYTEETQHTKISSTAMSQLPVHHKHWKEHLKFVHPSKNANITAIIKINKKAKGIKL